MARASVVVPRDLRRQTPRPRRQWSTWWRAGSRSGEGGGVLLARGMTSEPGGLGSSTAAGSGVEAVLGRASGRLPALGRVGHSVRRLPRLGESERQGAGQQPGLRLGEAVGALGVRCGRAVAGALAAAGARCPLPSCRGSRRPGCRRGTVPTPDPPRGEPSGHAPGAPAFCPVGRSGHPLPG